MTTLTNNVKNQGKFYINVLITPELTQKTDLSMDIFINKIFKVIHKTLTKNPILHKKAYNSEIIVKIANNEENFVNFSEKEPFAEKVYYDDELFAVATIPQQETDFAPEIIASETIIDNTKIKNLGNFQIFHNKQERPYKKVIEKIKPHYPTKENKTIIFIKHDFYEQDKELFNMIKLINHIFKQYYAQQILEKNIKKYSEIEFYLSDKIDFIQKTFTESIVLNGAVYDDSDEEIVFGVSLNIGDKPIKALAKTIDNRDVIINDFIFPDGAFFTVQPGYGSIYDLENIEFYVPDDDLKKTTNFHNFY